MAVDILAVGEAITDIVDRDGSIQEFSGGSPLNIAIGLGRLGRPVKLLAAIGNDARGRALAAHLAAAGVALAPGTVRDEPTSTARATIGADGAASYVFDIRWSLPPDVGAVEGILHVGSLGAFVEPGGTSVERLVAASASSGALVTFDPNIRPSICGPHAAAIRRFESIADHSTVVKLSDEDATWLYPDASPDDVLIALVERGVSLAVLTRGVHGAILRTADTSLAVAAAPATVVDTIGAGDSFMAAVLFQLAQGLEGDPTGALDLSDERLVELGRFSARCASITVSRAGANPPFLEELSRQ